MDQRIRLMRRTLRAPKRFPVSMAKLMDLKSLKVLIVDDEEDLLDTLVERMKMREINVSGVCSGESALEHLSQNAVDVVVMGVRMPGMDGVETLKEIKRCQPLVEVIMLTGLASVETATRVMELGAFDYLLKPIEIDQLIYKIQDAYLVKALKETPVQERAPSEDQPDAPGDRQEDT